MPAMDAPASVCHRSDRSAGVAVCSERRRRPSLLASRLQKPAMERQGQPVGIAPVVSLSPAKYYQETSVIDACCRRWATTTNLNGSNRNRCPMCRCGGMRPAPPYLPPPPESSAAAWRRWQPQLDVAAARRPMPGDITSTVSGAIKGRRDYRCAAVIHIIYAGTFTPRLQRWARIEETQGQGMASHWRFASLPGRFRSTP